MTVAHNERGNKVGAGIGNSSKELNTIVSNKLDPVFVLINELVNVMRL